MNLNLDVCLVVPEAYGRRWPEDDAGQQNLHRAVLQLACQFGGEVVDVPPLGRQGDTLEVEGSLRGIELHHLHGRAEASGEEEEGTDHEACSALPCLAVDDGHVIWMSGQPAGDVFAERSQQGELGRRMIVEGVDGDSAMELLDIITPL